MAESAGGGYDYEFLDSALASDYECMICQYVTREPQQAQCCGATYCSSCISRSRRTLDDCPNCRAPAFILISDKAQRQRINKLRVKCPHCDWTGEVADIQTHLELDHADIIASANKAVDFPTFVTEAEAITHAHNRRDSLEREKRQLSFSEFQKPTGGHQEDGDEGDEREPLLELKPLSDAEPLNAGNDEQNSPISPEQSRSISCCLSPYCVDVLYTSRTTKLLFWSSVATIGLWLAVSIASSVVALTEVSSSIENGHVLPIIPKCGYSVAFLLAVVLAQVLAAVYAVLWYLRLCECARNRKARIVAVIVLCFVTAIYAASVVGYSSTVFLPMTSEGSINTSNESVISSGSGSGYFSGSASGSGISGGGSGSGMSGGGSGMSGGGSGTSGSGTSGGGSGTSGGGSGTSGSGTSGGESGTSDGGSGTSGVGSGCGNAIEEKSSYVLENRKNDTPWSLRDKRVAHSENIEHQTCIELSSKPFVLAVIFLTSLFLFTLAISCMLALECSKCNRTQHYQLLTNLVSDEEASIEATRDKLETVN